MKKNKKAFSLIEVLVGMILFIMGMVSVYAIISSTMKLNSYNKDYIIASSLAREQIELVRNIRDTNFAKIQNYKILNPMLGYSTMNTFVTGTYYKIQNNFSDIANFSVTAEKWPNFKEEKSELSQNSEYKLCINDKKLYVYCNGDTNLKQTPFYKYIKIDPVDDYQNAFKVISKVVWVWRGYHSFEIQALFTDYKIF